MRFTEFNNLKIKYDECNIEKYKEKNVIKVRDKRTVLNEESVYEVYPIAIYNDQVYVVCPYCKEIHIHGYTGGSIPGYRSPFCISTDNSNKRGSYYIKEASRV